jgi:thiamine biosynthesis lipoprotein
MAVHRFPQVSRRRVLTIVAGAACAVAAGKAHGESLRRFVWRGTALGAPAEILLYHREPRQAAAAVEAARAEIERLEREFSLYRPDSAVSRLNRSGRLERPSLDLVELLAESVGWSERTAGAFDVTVQPLWRLHADHFAATEDGEGPSEQALGEALRRVDYRKLAITAHSVTLAPGMAITLNGIAQGYITDRVGDLLRERGWTRLLLGLGEWRAIGRRADGRPWSVAIADPNRPGRPLLTLPIADRAVAVSAGSATRFDRSGRHHHLFSPVTGRSAGTYAGVAVAAERATTADALSTALFVAPKTAAGRLVAAVPGTEAWLVTADGTVAHLAG